MSKSKTHTHLATGDCETDARVWVKFHDENLPTPAAVHAEETVSQLNVLPRSGYPWLAYPDTVKENLWHYEMPLCVAQRFMAELDDDRNVIAYDRE